MTTVSVRYIVSDVGEAIDFYCRHLGFREDMHPAGQLEGFRSCVTAFHL